MCIMEQQDVNQIKTIIENFEAAKHHVPYFCELAAHPMF